MTPIALTRFHFRGPMRYAPGDATVERISLCLLSFPVVTSTIEVTFTISLTRPIRCFGAPLATEHSPPTALSPSQKGLDGASASIGHIATDWVRSAAFEAFPALREAAPEPYTRSADAMPSLDGAAENVGEPLLSLALALHKLSRNGRLCIAMSVLKHTYDDFKNPGHSQALFSGAPLPAYSPTHSGEPSPWFVHLADAYDNLQDLQQVPPESDAEFSARLADVIVEAVRGIRVAAWAATDPHDFRRWDVGEVARGPYENLQADKVTRRVWKRIFEEIWTARRNTPRTPADGEPDAEAVREAVRRMAEDGDDAPTSTTGTPKL